MCDSFQHPISAAEEQMLDLTLDPRGWVYHWELHPSFDQMAMQFAADLGMGVIDMSPLYLRPDAHIGGTTGNGYHMLLAGEQRGAAPEKMDCLHYCLPGPVDLFNVLLLQALVEWNDEEKNGESGGVVPNTTTAVRRRRRGR